MKKLLALGMLTVVLAGPSVVSAQAIIDTSSFNQPSNSNRTFTSQSYGSISTCSIIKSQGVSGIVSCIIGFFNIATYLIMAGSVVYIVWGASKLMREEGREEGKNIVLYGIVGLFVMVSIWGLVNILDNTFNLSGGNAATPPQLVAPR